MNCVALYILCYIYMYVYYISIFVYIWFLWEFKGLIRRKNALFEELRYLVLGIRGLK